MPTNDSTQANDPNCGHGDTHNPASHINPEPGNPFGDLDPSYLRESRSRKERFDLLRKASSSIKKPRKTESENLANQSTAQAVQAHDAVQESRTKYDKLNYRKGPLIKYGFTTQRSATKVVDQKYIDEIVFRSNP